MLDVRQDNRLTGRVMSVNYGSELARVELSTSAGTVFAVAPRDAVERMAISPGDTAYALVSPVDLFISREPRPKISAANHVAGRIRGVHEGPRVTGVVLDTDAGELLALVETDGWKNCELNSGDEAHVVFKATVTRITVDPGDPQQRSLPF